MLHNTGIYSPKAPSLLFTAGEGNFILINNISSVPPTRWMGLDGNAVNNKWAGQLGPCPSPDPPRAIRFSKIFF